MMVVGGQIERNATNRNECMAIKHLFVTITLEYLQYDRCKSSAIDD